MADLFWFWKGAIAVDEAGRPFLCDHCPCVPPTPTPSPTATPTVSGPTPTPTMTGASATPTPTPTMDNECNDCDPPIPDTLYVTFSGEGGDFAAYNGKHAVKWASSCIWTKTIAAGTKWIKLEWSNPTGLTGRWYVYLRLNRCCREAYRTTSLNAPCNPTVTYEYYGCTSYTAYGCPGCEDEQSCAKSSGATCVVSYT